MAIGEVYKVDHIYRWTGNDGDTAVECRNTYFYQQQTGASANAAQPLRVAFQDIQALIDEVAPDFITWVGLDVVNIARPVDFYQALLTGAGNRVEESEATPSWLALQYKSQRAYPGTRSARKRYPFLYEQDIAGNELTTEFFTSPEVTALAAGLSAEISNTGNTFYPVVVEHPVVLTETPVIRYTITGFAAQPKVSSQNTRKE